MFLKFSMHPNTKDLGNHAFYAKGYTVKTYQHIWQLAQAVTQNHNSPVIWKYGIRKQENFAFAEFAVLDCDEGAMTLLEAQEEFKPYRHIIGTTKSHQQLKGNKVCDRYRVFLALEKRVEKAEDYAATNTALAKRYGGDLQAVAAHMAFMPLKEIVGFSADGKLLPISVYIPVVVQKNRPPNAIYSKNREIPDYIREWLQFGAPAGQANLTCFKIASGLARRGFYEDEIVEIVLNSSVPTNRTSQVEKEVRSAVRSAVRRK